MNKKTYFFFLSIMMAISLNTNTLAYNRNSYVVSDYKTEEIENISISPYASAYINFYDVNISMNSTNEKITYSANITAFQTSDEIKILGNVLELRNATWTLVDTFNYSVYNRGSAFYSGSYIPIKGRSYRISASFYVKVGNGSDIKNLDSVSCTAK